MTVLAVVLAAGTVVFADAWRHAHPRPPAIPPAPRLIGWAIDGCGRPRTRIPLGEYEPVALIPDAGRRWQAALDRATHHQIGATP